MSKEYKISFKDDTFLIIKKENLTLGLQHCRYIETHLGPQLQVLDWIQLPLCTADKLEYFINDICHDIRLENLEKAHQELKEE